VHQFRDSRKPARHGGTGPRPWPRRWGGKGHGPFCGQRRVRGVWLARFDAGSPRNVAIAGARPSCAPLGGL